jgi:hypothetical protein
MNMLEECRAMSDAELEQALKFLVEREKHGLAKLLAHLAEYDRRQACVKRGHSTLYLYCIQVLGYDESGAFRRIRAARITRRWPEVLGMIERGALHLTALVVLHPILTDANRKELFASAEGKTRREIDALVAERMPQPPHADFARRLPVPGGWSIAVAPPVHVVEAVSTDGSAAGTPAQTPPPAATAPAIETPAGARPWEWQAVVHTALDRVRIGFDAGISVLRLIDRARQVLRHKYPEGRLEDVMRDALETLLDRKDPQRRLTLKPASVVRDAASPEPETPREPRALRDMKAGRYIPAWVKRIVWERDDGRCAWRFPEGTVCGSKDWIEYDHVKPFAKGGKSDSPRNVRLLCRLHNREAAAAAGVSAARESSG